MVWSAVRMGTGRMGTGRMGTGRMGTGRMAAPVRGDREQVWARTPEPSIAALAGPVFGEVFDVAVRGYNRRDVDDFAEHARRQVADLEEQLARALGEAERLRAELATARQPPADRPAHEEVSERIGQIFTLAGQETQAQQDRAAQAIATLRFQAQEEANTCRDAAISQTQQMLAAAQEHAERAITTARAEASAATSTAQAQAEAMTAAGPRPGRGGPRGGHRSQRAAAG